MTDRNLDQIKLTNMHYKVLDKLASVQNFRRSAKELNLSISVISKYIKDLEAFYQVPLFYRTTRQVTLTDELKRILPRVREILALESEIKNDGSVLLCLNSV
ncbi:LysR family transcriptional regulator [Fangia hongkongensis]|uniref:LysR family transcriptional regulator n=1 Tax=Fangia hongkongensis TaxID=270495 RepID=UPI00036DA51D|nr:LysR family transcriptional regulator [Fangia hongkongensis]MBK2124748.1 LysR family transcriptional regulator [Fangia hongkongensis]